MELYGGTEWRTSERDDIKRCIRRILERELADSYQKNARPSEEVRGKLGEMVWGKLERRTGGTRKKRDWDDSQKRRGQERRKSANTEGM